MTKRRDGFTLVEVMVSLGVMTIGAMALMAMQQQTTRANIHAREMTMATQIAQNWVERLKLDAMQWTTTQGTVNNDLANTTYLQAILANPGDGVFQQVLFTPLGSTTRFAGYNYLGDEIDPSAAPDEVSSGALASQTLRYCASYRMSWVYLRRAMRADVRVWWPRDMLGSTTKATANNIVDDFPGCDDNNTALNPGGAEFDNYHVVYLSTTLRPVNF